MQWAVLHRWRRTDEYSSGESQLCAEFRCWCIHTEHVSRGKASPQHPGLLLWAVCTSSQFLCGLPPVSSHCPPTWTESSCNPDCFFFFLHRYMPAPQIWHVHSGNFVISFPFPPSALISLFCPLSLHHTDICVPVVEISARLSHSCIRRADTSQLICIYCPCVCMCVFSVACGEVLCVLLQKFWFYSSPSPPQWWPKNMDPSLSFKNKLLCSVVRFWRSRSGPVRPSAWLLRTAEPGQVFWSSQKDHPGSHKLLPLPKFHWKSAVRISWKELEKIFKIVKHTNTHEQITHKKALWKGESLFSNYYIV